MEFLPSLRPRSRRLSRATETAAAAIGGPAAAAEVKQLLGAYFDALSRSGHSGARRRWPVERAVEEGVERVVWTFKAVQAIGINTARLRYRLLDEGQEVDDHPLYRLLNQRANPLETGRQFRQRLMAQILLSKAGAFVEVTRSNAGTPMRLDLLPPSRTRIIPGTGADLVAAFEVARVDGTRTYLGPDRVMWFREPHPIDPYCGLTPLEPAGLTIELDYLADLYNSTFLRNDGRPGGVLSVGADMDPADMKVIEERYGGAGPWSAGKLSVVTGELAYVDVAKSPRDMAYGDLAAATKDKILTAFGTPESVLGNASGRTWDNAAQEQENWWQFTLLPLMDLIVAEFDRWSDDGLTGEFDTDDVEPLQRVKKLRRQEAREEYQAGLISADEYREIAGYPVIDLPFTRALYVPAGKTPVPTRQEDAEALGMASPVEQAPPGAGTGPQVGGEVQPIGAPPADGGPLAIEPGSPDPSAQPGSALQVEQKTPVLPAAAGGTVQHPSPRARMLSKVTVLRPGQAAEPPAAVDARERARLEDAVAAALTATTVRLCERAVARVDSPKMRRHTRHWQREYEHDTRVGTKALDTVRAVDPGRWAAEVQADVGPVLADAAGWFPGGHQPEVLGVAAQWVARQAEQRAHQAAAMAAAADAGGEPISKIVAEVRSVAGGVPGWARQIAAAAVAGVARAANQNGGRAA